jgi:hypothetical protein
MYMPERGVSSPFGDSRDVLNCQAKDIHPEWSSEGIPLIHTLAPYGFKSLGLMTFNVLEVQEI